MARLKVTNGYSEELTGLGKIRPFCALSEKRITRCTRENLRAKYGYAAVQVSCSAAFDGTDWRGACEINGVPLQYRVCPQ